VDGPGIMPIAQGRDMGASRQWEWSAIGTFFFSRVVVYIFSFVVLEAGAGGGLAASIATCPLDVIKTKLQAQRAVQGQKAYLSAYGVLYTFLFFKSQSILILMTRYVEVCFQRERVTWPLSRIGAYDTGISTCLGYLFYCI
jgi:hypothetical protein